MWAEFNVQYGSSVTTYSGLGHVDATRLKHKSETQKGQKGYKGKPWYEVAKTQMYTNRPM